MVSQAVDTQIQNFDCSNNQLWHRFAFFAYVELLAVNSIDLTLDQLERGRREHKWLKKFLVTIDYCTASFGSKRSFVQLFLKNIFYSE